jgi:integrase
MALTDTQIKNSKPSDKQYKLSDGGGMYLLVTPAGGKLWRFDYRFEDRRKTLAMGAYPEISLAEARSKLLDARRDLSHGVDPGAKAWAEKQPDSFKAVALEWHSRMLPTWTEGHAKTIIGRLERDVFPWIGKDKIKDITAPDVLRVLRRVEARGAIESAHRIKTVCGQVFRYAIATGRAERDQAADLKGALTPVSQKHMAAITEPELLAGLLRSIDDYQGSFVVRCALKIQAYTFVRPGELRHAEWSEIDLDAAQWNIPAEKMKMRAPHIVPLARQVVAILKDLHPLTGAGQYVFPNGRTNQKPMSENAILGALRNMDYTKEQMTGHGFRAAARTILDEILQQRIDLVEHQLAHAVKDVNGRAYNRTRHLPARQEMMQTWADYLDGLKAGAQVIPLRKTSGE